MKTKQIALIIAFLVLLVGLVIGNSFFNSKSEYLDFDTKAVKGKLNNGLTYYIRENSKPKDNVIMRLVIKAGSILETDKQQGLAHYLEHMAFNGSKNFSKNEVISYLESTGVEFGADLNAYTSFDQTIYELSIPLDNPDNLEQGMQIMADWAGELSLKDEDIDNERKVIVEEWRLGRGAQERMNRKISPKLWKDSLYAKRLPIGKLDVIENFNHDELRDFYKDWYRPNLMAVIVVGNINSDEIKNKISKYFSNLSNPKNGKKRFYVKIPTYKKHESLVVTDKEASNIVYLINFSAKKQANVKTTKEYKDNLMEYMFVNMLNKRYSDLQIGSNPPFRNAGFYYSFQGNNKQPSIYFLANNNLKLAMNSVVKDLLDVLKYGFSDREYKLGKKSLLSYIEQKYNERAKTDSNDFVENYLEDYLRDSTALDIVDEKKLIEDFLSATEVDDFNQTIKNYLTDEDLKNAFVYATGPSFEEGKKLPSAEDLSKIYQASLEQIIIPNATTKKVEAELLSELPAKGEIIKTAYDEKLDVYTYILSNGLKVHVKKTDLQDDEISLRAVKKGGTSTYPATDKFNLYYLNDVIDAMGYGDFTPNALNDTLTGKNIQVGFSLGRKSSSIYAKSSIKDQEDMFKLLFLEINNPRRDKELFDAAVSKFKERVEFLDADPKNAFRQYWYTQIYNNNPFSPIAYPTVAQIQSLDLDRILEIYKQEFSQAQGFEFFIVGNLDKEKLETLLTQYIASLDTRIKSVHEIKDTGLRIMDGKKRFNFYKGAAKQGLVISAYHNLDVKHSEDLTLYVEVVKEMLNIEINKVLREEKQLIYSGGFSARLEKEPFPRIIATSWLPSDPNKVDQVIKCSQGIIQDMFNKPKLKVLEKVQSILTENMKEYRQANEFWLDLLEDSTVWGVSSDRYLKYENFVDQINLDNVKNTAAVIFDNKNQINGVLLPESFKK